MHSLIHKWTNKIATKKGMVITLMLWLVFALILFIFAPSSKEYSVNNVSQLYPASSPSIIAEKKIDTYFNEDDGVPGIFVLEQMEGELDTDAVLRFDNSLNNKNISYVKSILPLSELSPEATKTFISKDKTAAFLPILFEEHVTSKEIKKSLKEMEAVTKDFPEIQTYLTGPAGIAVDATDLFSRADFVLLFSTIGIILILLIFTYRSPLLAIIPLLAAGFVYIIADHILGILGANGIELASQSLSIMMVLLFALIIDYSLFIFSRFREELKRREDKFVAMQYAMQQIGIPIFYSSSTILLTMLVLFMTDFGDYRNFAPVFTVAILVVMIAAITLVPALFTLFGRKAFWPKVPKAGQQKEKANGIWRKIGNFVSLRPILSVMLVFTFLILTSSQIFTIQYEYNTMKSFPEDMPSRVGYEILETKFSKGTLAATKVIFEGKSSQTDEQIDKLIDVLANVPLVDHVRLTNQTKDKQVLQFELTFQEDPFAVESMNALEKMMQRDNEILANADTKGEFYFAGETASSIDNRYVNIRDLIKIVLAETLLIYGMLCLLTRSVKIAGLMIGTILLSFVAALGLGSFLSDFFFDVHAISNRVPVYAFVFLVSLGIDYNIFLVSRYMEERKYLPITHAVTNSVSHTGGVISSAGVILAATFAVLMTQPIEVLSIFGFIVAIGIIIDTFLVRGVLFPGLLVLLEKNQHLRLLKRKNNKRN